MSFNAFSGLDLLDTAVIALDHAQCICYVNPAAENLLDFTLRNVNGQSLHIALPKFGSVLHDVVDSALNKNVSIAEHDLRLSPTTGSELRVDCTVTPIESPHAACLLEIRPIDQQMKIANEERILVQQQANKELIRNLAHEIKNPLGGIRGAAQLLEHELDRKELTEYTQVIIQESERLQSLIDRLLTPHRIPQVAEVNIHEVLERVRSLLLAEVPQGLTIRRDYDTSLPPVTGDKEQLIQVVLNIARNAVQAMLGKGEITLRTRVSRQVTLVRKRYRLALCLQIVDNGPGIPPHLRDNIFYPLVSGRPDGTGLGLTLAQNYIQQHQGTIDFDSRPGYTNFTILLPIGAESKDKT
ncbi:nitrogen regulation protein NR(II) [Chitinivorax sp. B]|uniref:nitrogen regulation protein NR(II) n=1 Tax=Chitinivorax sp. B TaxID=2502235 RepID=UPI0010F68865|nr:nitrogen regulation protein NR(II) [Chitinivorax sp. B]